MSNLRHLIVDLRAHAHEVPEPIRTMMRQAAAALDGCEPLLDADTRPAPIPPPQEKAHAQG